MCVAVNQWVYQTAVELPGIFDVECVATNMFDGVLISVHEWANWEWNRNEEIEMKRIREEHSRWMEAAVKFPS